MAYYTAVLARSGGQWQLRPSDIDAPEDLAEVSDAVRTASRGRGGLAIVEREDEWFAIVRVDGEEDPRIFVSDLPAARQGPFAVLFEDVEEWERPALSGSGAAERAGDGGQDLVAAGTGRSRVAGDHAAGLGGGDDTAGATGDEPLSADDDDDDDDDDGSLTGEADQDTDVLDSTDDFKALGGLDDMAGLDDVDGSDDADGLDAEDPGVGGLDVVGIEDEDDEADEDVTVSAATARGRTRHDVADFAPSTEGGGRRGGQSGDGGVALAPAPLEEVVWAGDLGLLEDYGLAPQTLKLIVEDGDPSAALLAIGEQAGFADVIDEWH